MSQALARSPVAEIVAELLTDVARQAEAAAVLGIADVSLAARCGCKGPGTVAWLDSLEVPVPAKPNTWLPLGKGGRIARLGMTEFLVEGDAAVVERLTTTPRAAGVYPVQHEDAALILGGARVNELLRQTCNVNFAALDAADRPVVLTSLIGVGVTVLPEQAAQGLIYRIWCDGSYGRYLFETLHDIAHELGGGTVFPQHLYA
jgi:sarcosine oxidase subunit gamma